MAKKSGSERKADPGEDFHDAVARLRREAAPAIAKALDLDRAEAAEAALASASELALAARSFLRALPMPPETREHLDRAEREALRAAKLAVGSIVKERRGASAPLKAVTVDFKKDASRNRKGAPRRNRK